MSQTSQQPSVGEQFQVQGNRMMEKMRELIKAGNARSVVVKHRGDVVAKLPLTVGVIAAAIAPWLAAIGVIAVFLTESSLSVELNPSAPGEIRPSQPTSTQGRTPM